MTNLKKISTDKVIMTITNSGDTDLRTLITPGSLGITAKGLISSTAYKGISADGSEASTATLTAAITNSSITVSDFLFQVAEGAIVIKKIRTLVSGQASGMIDKIVFTPFRFGQVANPVEIYLDSYFDASTNNEMVVDADVAMSLDKFVKTEVFSIPAKSTVKIHFYVVGVSNDNESINDIIVGNIGGNVINRENDSVAQMVDERLSLTLSQDTSYGNGVSVAQRPVAKPNFGTSSTIGKTSLAAAFGV